MGTKQEKSDTVFHIRADSETELQALFDTVLRPDSTDNRPKQVPLRQRKLPDSFFNPSSTGSRSSVNHSRENSADSTLNPPSRRNQVAANHSRSWSSPASLNQTLSVAHPINPTSPTSSTAGSSGNLAEEPLPAGWEQSTTPQGQIYYINHITRTTTWEDPRRSGQMMEEGTGSGGSNTNAPPSQPPPIQVTSSSVNEAELTAQQIQAAVSGPLPAGWEQAVTGQGEVYFINHTDRSTSWFDPRIPAHLQRLSKAVLQHQALAQQGLAGAKNGTNVSTIPNPGLPPPINQGAPNGSVTALIEQKNRNSSSGANGTERNAGSTSQVPCTAGPPVFSANSSERNIPFQTTTAGVRIQQLEQKKEQLIQVQQEILRQMEQAEARIPQSSQNRSMEDGAEMDQFVGGSLVDRSGSDFHSRQESADSGLGMGTGYSIPNTPENFLAPMDDSMDIIAEAVPSMDYQYMGSLGLDHPDATDELTPSLQVSDELNNEVLTIINSRPDTMTWL